MRAVDTSVEYLDVLRHWEREVVFPLVYSRLDELLPEYGFKRRNGAGIRDHWASPLKIDCSAPKVRCREKTVVYPEDLCLREQGDWNNPVKVLDVVCRREGLSSLYEFNCWMARRYALDMPRPDSAEVRRNAARRLRAGELLEELRDYFMWNLWNNNSRTAGRARAYLTRERGLSKDVLQRFGVGFVPAWEKVIHHVTVRKGFSKEVFEEVCGELSQGGRSPLGRSHTVAVPYICGGLLKGFLYRTADPEVRPKYLAGPGLDRASVFFGIPQGQADTVVVMEGEMDVLSAIGAGLEGAVAIGGSEISGDRRRQVEDAFRRGVRRITLFLDLDALRDGSGNPDLQSRYRHVMASVHTIKDIRPDFEEIYVVCPTEVCDPDSYVRERGAEEFRRLVEDAVPYWKYVYEYHISCNTE